MMTLREYILNMEATAQRLTGRDVHIRIKELPAGVCGIAQRDRTGQAVIDLSPGILGDVRKFAETLTHELAHVKRHYYDLPRRDIDQGIEKEISRARVHVAARTAYKRHEDEADTLAADWMKVVNRHYWNYSASEHDPVMAVLKILYHKIT